MSLVIWITSERNEKIPTVDGFIYRLHSIDNDAKYYWKCKHATCSSKLETVGMTQVSHKGDHLHSNDLLEILKCQLRTLIKQKVLSDPLITSTAAFNFGISQLGDFYTWSEDYVCLFPSFDSMKSNIYRWKSSASPLRLVLDADLFDVRIFDLPTGASMLLYHALNPEKIIIMGNIEYIRRFTSINTLKLVMDGTFKSSSTEFKLVHPTRGI